MKQKRNIAGLSLGMLFFFAVVTVVIKPITSHAGEIHAVEQTDLNGQVLIQAVDGSRIVGKPHVTSLRFVSSLGDFEVPFSQLKQLTIGRDHETATLDLQNGDHLTSVIISRSLPVTAAWSTVQVGMEQVCTITTLGGSNAVPATLRKGLVMWNRLESESEVSLSTVGLGGSINGGRFVEGRFGMGVELSVHETHGLTFQPELGRAQAGCIEFWAKLISLPGGSPQDLSLPLLNIGGTKGEDGCDLFLSPNDGKMNAGLCIRSRLGSVGSAYLRSWHSECSAKACTDGNWHHFAMVWSGTGKIPGLTDAKRKIVLFFDGQLNTKTGVNTADETFLFQKNLPVYLGLPGRGAAALPPARIVFDNLRVWNYAKTDFSDRNEE